MNNICPICFNKTKTIYSNTNFINHINFENIKKKIILNQCSYCSTVFNVKDVSNYFSSIIYKKSNQTKQKIKIPNDNKKYYRAELQRKIINKNTIYNKAKRILDIGSFDGRLLKDINKYNKKIDLYGYDITLPPKNYYNDKIKYIKTLEISKKFDLIILSHSIFYFNNIKKLLSQLSNLTHSKSSLMIQIPDLKVNPYNILLGDQKYYFSDNSIKNIFKFYNFKLTKIKNNYFERDLLYIGKKISFNRNKNYLKKNDNVISGVLSNILNIRNKLLEKKFNNVCVFGTTSSAAFFDNILKGKNKLFVDENCKYNNSKFRNKKILHPKELSKNHIVLLPFINKNKLLLNRLNNKYKSKFIYI